MSARALKSRAPVAAGAPDVSMTVFGDAVAIVDRRSGAITWTSEAWAAMQPLLAAGADATALEDRLPGVTQAIAAAIKTRESRDARVGDARQWSLRLALLDDTRLALRLTDRREQSRALQRQLDDREQLLFTSRVISVGEMAATLAHELNQPIGATANLLRGLRARAARRSALDRDEASALDQAIEQVMFAARVIARIREFTHSHQPRFAPVELVALLRSSAALLDWDLQRTGARLVLELPEAPTEVRGDAVMLQQVVVNLMRNALDALRADPPADPQLALQLTLRESEIEIQVRDNGCGLSDAAAAKLFVPFASTKPSGMGIGLLICRSFVEQHQGRLWFSRNEDRGATFHLSLPRSPA